MSITVAGYIPRSGQTAAFLIKTTAVPPVPVSPTSIAGVPVIYQNGVPITPLAHVITSIATTGAGSGYTANNVVTATVTSANGAGATATTTIAAGHTTITAGWVMTCSGWGFQWGDTCTVTITGGSGSGATATATIGPYWSVTSRDCPFVFYPLPSALSPSDVITFDMPAGTVVTASGSNTAITSQSITNCTGGVEPDCIPSSQTLKLGMGMSGQQSQSQANGTDVANWLTKMDMAWTNAVLTYDGWPTYLNAGTTQTRIANTDNSNYVDSNLTPTPPGTWTFVATESAPATPMTVALKSFGSNGTITGPTITGTGVGKTWVWTAVLSGAATNWNMDLGLVFTTHSGAAGANTLTYGTAALYAPDDAGNVAAKYPNLLAPSGQEVLNLTTPSGKSPAFVRYIGQLLEGGGGASSCVDADDLISATAVGWGDTIQTGTFESGGWPSGSYTGSRLIQVTQTRALSTSNSPNVYVSQQYPGTVSSGGGPLPYMFASVANYEWLNPYPGFADTYFVGECVCSNPHNLKSGQYVGFSASAPTNLVLTNLAGSGTGTATIQSLAEPIWVTGPNTFAFYGFAKTGVTSTTLANTLSVTDNTAYTVSITVPESAVTPIESAAERVNAYPGCAFWCNIPLFMTDAAVAVYAQRARDSLDLGHEIWLELANEHWNTNFFASAACGQLGALIGNMPSLALNQAANGNCRDQYFALRSMQIKQIFIDVFNAMDINGNTNRGGSVKLILGSWRNGPSLTQVMVSYVNAYNAINTPVSVEYFAIALYLNSPVDIPFVTAAASYVPANSRSIAYGTTVPWTLAMFHDVNRWNILYSIAEAGPNCWMAQQLAELTSYTAVPGQDPVQLTLYECSPANLVIPAGTYNAPGYSYLWAELSHDAVYHPDHYYNYVAMWCGIQNLGISVTDSVFYCQPRYNSGVYGTACYAFLSHHMQAYGRGDGSLASNGLHITNQFWKNTAACEDINNASVALQAWRDWADVANLAPSGGSSAATIAVAESRDIPSLFAGFLGGALSITESRDSPSFFGGFLAAAAAAISAGSDTAAIRATITMAAVAKVSPSRIQPNTSSPGITLALFGIDTSWTSGSSVSIQNSVTGTTTVTAGTWTAITSTMATLVVTTGAGIGTFTITVDGVVSQPESVAPKKPGWFSGLRSTAR